METVLITGGLGFIGSHIAEKFHSQKHKVILVDNLSRPFSPNPNSVDSLYTWNFFRTNYPDIIIYKEDIRNRDALSQIFSQHFPTLVIHAAGQTSAVGSIEDPKKDFENNVIGLFNTLDISRQIGTVRNFLYLSTNKVYGEKVNSIPLKEQESRFVPEDPLFLGITEDFSIDQSKHTPYGISKLTGDLYVQEFGRLYGFNTACFRMSCIYGDRQFGFIEQGWISYLIYQALKNKPIPIFGTGKQVRDVLYIEDLSEMYYRYAIWSGKSKYDVFNIGGGIQNTLSLIEAIRIIGEIHGKDPLYEYHPERSGDQRYYVSDISKICQKLDWVPKISPKSGIIRSYQWQKHLNL